MTPPISIAILDGPLPPLPPFPQRALCGSTGTALPPSIPNAGALLTFEGVVRPLEDNREILALDYQAYEPMATRQLTALAQDISARHQLLHLSVQHSRGRVPAGQTSFRLTIAAPHRREALAAMTEFIDKLKQDVPIWKMPVWR